MNLYRPSGNSFLNDTFASTGNRWLMNQGDKEGIEKTSLAAIFFIRRLSEERHIVLALSSSTSKIIQSAQCRPKTIHQGICSSWSMLEWRHPVHSCMYLGRDKRQKDREMKKTTRRKYSQFLVILIFPIIDRHFHWTDKTLLNVSQHPVNGNRNRPVCVNESK